MLSSPDVALVGGRLYTQLVEVTGDVSALDGRGQWVVVLPFSGSPVCARFRRTAPAPALSAGSAPSTGRTPGGSSAGAPTGPWTSSLDRPGYVDAVERIRRAIAAGDVYQVNLCRRLSAPVHPRFDVVALGHRLRRSHPAPHQAVVALPSAGVFVASASPERFLRRDGMSVESRPIKGTASTAAGLNAKDAAENVMIVDLVRNDLGRVCEYGSVEVPSLLRVEEHPGLVHLVSTVRGRLRRGVGWAELLDATFPPGSVTGAPKRAALEMIAALEPADRGVYCGAVGWVDADRQAADLNVAIRTFWVEGGMLHLGTGAGITWGSSAAGEWDETELKARRLLALVAARGGHGTAA